MAAKTHAANINLSIYPYALIEQSLNVHGMIYCIILIEYSSIVNISGATESF